MNFSKNIKTLRQSRGLTQRELASQLNISIYSIGSYEEGRANPNYGKLIEISEFFDVTIDQLLKSELKISITE